MGNVVLRRRCAGWLALVLLALVILASLAQPAYADEIYEPDDPAGESGLNLKVIVAPVIVLIGVTIGILITSSRNRRK
ncbi:MAG: hypothetical protein IIY82_00150 [Firmicutes bacterium]|nr:hypothetical protein [Bacillota bacterium]